MHKPASQFSIICILALVACGCEFIGGYFHNEVENPNRAPTKEEEARLLAEAFKMIETVEQKFADNNGVKIEYLLWAGSSDQPPIVLVPGLLGSASSWTTPEIAPLINSLHADGARSVIAISLRGRGASDCPEKGWTLADHHSDIEAVLSDNDIKVKPICTIQ